MSDTTEAVLHDGTRIPIAVRGEGRALTLYQALQDLDDGAAALPRDLPGSPSPAQPTKSTTDPHGAACR